MSKSKKQAFTLIELLVVISIIALLVAILMPALGNARKQAKATKCLANQKQIGVAMYLYADDNNNNIPRREFRYKTTEPWKTWQFLFAKYSGAENVTPDRFYEIELYNCPSYPDKDQTFDYVTNGVDFTNNFNGGPLQKSYSKLDSIKRKQETVYLADYEDMKSTKNQNTSLKIIRTIDLQNNPNILIDNASPIRYFDIEHDAQLANGTDQFRRVARNRHGNEGCNNLFFDSHAEWLNYKDNGRWAWGGRRNP